MNAQAPLSQSTKLVWWRQMRGQLVLYFVALAVLSIVVVTAFALTQLRTQSTEQAFKQMESVAQLKDNQIRRWLDYADQSLHLIQEDINRYGNLGDFMTYAADNDVNARGTLFFTAQTSRQLRNFISGWSDTDEDAGVTEPILVEAFVYDRRGVVIAASNATTFGKVVTRQPYFENSLTDAYIQSPYYEVGTGELTMLVTQPILDKNGKPAGAVAARLNLDTLSEIMTERAGLGETGETYLVSIENNYLLTPSRFEGYPLNRAYHTDGIDRALAGENGAGTYTNYRDQLVLGVYHWLPELNAALMAEIDESEAQALFVQTSTVTIVLTVGIGLAAAMLGLLAATRISKPISVLTNVATQIAGGDLNMRADIHQQNEIGVLAEAFNQMTGRLVQTIEEVNHTNKALRIATAQAKEAARLKSEFLSTVSHELRTPLNAIIGFTGIMLEGMGGEVDDEAQHMIRRVEANSQRLLALINDILDLAKIESGRMEIASQPIAPRKLAEQWHAQMAVLAEKRGLNFDVEVDPALPDIVYGDAARITQVVTNLLSNAFKFTERGSVRLCLKCQQNDWQIEVADTGVGIPSHALNYIFDEFRQVDGTSRRVFGGSGLGLAIVRNLCLMMGGSVRVNSQVGRGSVFTVTIPLVTEEESPLAVFANA